MDRQGILPCRSTGRRPCRPPFGLFHLPPARGIEEGNVKGQSEERDLFPVGAHPVRDRAVPITSAVAHWVRSYREKKRFSTAMCRVAARAFIPPLCSGEGWTIRPRRGARHGCRALFVRAGARSKSPAAPHGLAGRSPDSATRGAVLFGYFLLGKQEKVTRAAAAVRKPAVPRGLPSVAGEPSRDITTTEDGRETG